MIKCIFCNRECKTFQGMKYHSRFCKLRRDDVVIEMSFDDMTYGYKRRFLLKEANFKCSICSFDKVRENGQTILEIDHIDGDHTNNQKQNLRVLCPNCHALTNTFRNCKRQHKKNVLSRERKGKKNFVNVLEIKKKIKQEKDQLFIDIVNDVFDNQMIKLNSSWKKKLTDIVNQRLGTNLSTKSVQYKLVKLLPDIYNKFCCKEYMPRCAERSKALHL